MRKALAFALIGVGMLFAAASTAPPEEVDASTSRRDGGSSGNDAAAGQDTGTNPGTWNPQNYGKVCASESDCPGGQCAAAYTGQGSPNTCWKNCAAPTDCSDFPMNQPGVMCADLGLPGGSVCVAVSGQNGWCGNVVNSVCDPDGDYASCWVLFDDGSGLCMRICNPNNPGTSYDGCTAIEPTDPSCGCIGSDGCSIDMLAFGDPNDPESVTNGICAPVTSIGATCGFDETTGAIVPCTGDQTCDGLSETSNGTCAQAQPDAGTTTDAG